MKNSDLEIHVTVVDLATEEIECMNDDLDKFIFDKTVEASKKEPAKHPCEFCHGYTVDDARGNCGSCGHGRRPSNQIAAGPPLVNVNFTYTGPKPGTEEYEDLKKIFEAGLKGIKRSYGYEVLEDLPYEGSEIETSEYVHEYPSKIFGHDVQLVDKLLPHVENPITFTDWRKWAGGVRWIPAKEILKDIEEGLKEEEPSILDQLLHLAVRTCGLLTLLIAFLTALLLIATKLLDILKGWP